MRKVVVITGASSGIGKALGYEYAKRGYAVVLAARNLNKLNAIHKDLLSKGHEVLVVKTDVSKEVDCENLISKTIEKYTTIDILINNAGLSMRALFKDVDLKVLKELMDVNFWGTVYCTKYALPYLLKAKGTVVGVVSIAAFIGLPARSGYAASKYAIRGFLDTLRVENLKTGLHVLVAAPGYTSSNIRNAALVKDGSPQGDSPRNEGNMMSAEKVAYRIMRAVDKKQAELILTFKEGKLSVFLKKTFPRLLDKLTYDFLAKEQDSPL
ncbi:MAG: SDR family oxidoreductase [Bacteroidales bacterium]|nr:SDR family oxidoreductase [Bacteroidales bacterium]